MFVPSGRVCCRPNHELQLKIYRPHAGMCDKEIMLIDRPFKCAGLCCTFSDCCAQKASLYAAPTCEQQAEAIPDHLVAIVQQPLGGGGFVPTLNVRLAEGADPIALGVLAFKATVGFGGVLSLASVLLRKVFEAVATSRSSQSFVAAR